SIQIMMPKKETVNSNPQICRTPEVRDSKFENPKWVCPSSLGCTSDSPGYLQSRFECDRLRYGSEATLSSCGLSPNRSGETALGGRPNLAKSYWLDQWHTSVHFMFAANCPRKPAIAVALAGIAWLASASGPRANPQDQNPPPPGTIRVQAPSVVVDVIATDKKGQPATGLTAADFKLFENNNEQKIVAFVPPVKATEKPSQETAASNTAGASNTLGATANPGT